MLNVSAIVGRLVADPVLKTTASGKEVASFCIACDRGRKDAGADFLDCVAWEKRADFICRYFQKGSMISVTGRLQSRQYEDKNGQKRKAVEIVVSEASFAGGKTESRQPDVQTAAADGELIGDDEDLPFN